MSQRRIILQYMSAESEYEGALNEALPTLAIMDSLGNKD